MSLKLNERFDQLLAIIREETEETELIFRVPDDRNRQLLAYEGMANDLTFCLNALERMKKERADNTLVTALYFSFIITYGKCFTDATGSKSPKLEENIFEYRPDLKEYHSEIMSLRHNYVAHRGTTIEDIGIAYITLHTDREGISAHAKGLIRITTDLQSHDSYVKTVSFVKDVTYEKFKKLAVKIWNHLLNEKSNSHLESMIIAGRRELSKKLLRKARTFRLT